MESLFGENHLHLAIKNNDVYLATMIFDKDPNLMLTQTFNGNTPLHYAVSCKDP